MKERILEGALEVFREKGAKFTMDDIATFMKMSKKTIYTVFRDKNELMCDLMDYAFDLIKAAEDEIYYDDSLTTVEKIRKILAVLPESHCGVDYSGMNQLAEKYPKVYAKLQYRLATGWDKTFELLNNGINNGDFRKFDVELFKIMYEAILERLLLGGYLETAGKDYPKALNDIVDIMVDGIIKGE
ncbi:MAG: TetR/AcrR family transcriptional regulator [Pseudobutyrivibrio sp.]|nr:TetR/AcrR family transcriptional regulator [Pseudobutyrivibrio sp.]